MVQMRQPYERPALKQDAKAAMAKNPPRSICFPCSCW